MGIKRLVMILVLLLLVGGSAGARSIRQGDQCIIGADETIEGSLFALCRVLVIDGVVEGNLFGAAASAEINGTVRGDVYLIAGQLAVAGTAGDDLHFAGPALRVQPGARFTSPRGDLISLSVSTTVAPETRIPGSVAALGYQLALQGRVDGEVGYLGQALHLSGAVGGDVDAIVGGAPSSGVVDWLGLLFPSLLQTNVLASGLVVDRSARVGGDLRYTSPDEAAIAGQVEGQVIHTAIVVQPDLTQIISEEEGNSRSLGMYLSQALQEFLTLGALGVVGLALVYRPFQQPTLYLKPRPVMTLAAGAATLALALPVALAAAVFSLLATYLIAQLQLGGLTLVTGTILAIANVSGVALFYLAAVFLSRVMVALFIGRLVVQTAIGDDGSARITYISLFAGALIVALLSALPAVGGLVNLAAAIFGLGALARAVYSLLRHSRGRPLAAAFRPPPPLESREGEPPFPPPIADDAPRMPGMDNLPPGFRWWDD